MNNNKIAFIICVLNENQFKACISHINDLEIPLGIEVDVISIRESNNIARAYNTGLNQTDAKYKVYLHSNTYIINKNLIKDLFDIFVNNNQVGLIGVVGAKRLPSNGLWWNDVGKVGEVNILSNGTNQYYKLNNIIEKYEIVEAVDGLIMATQFDIKWKEEIFDGLYFYDISECMEFNKKGFQVVVPRQEKTWCIHDWGTEVNNEIQNETEKYRKIFLGEYPIIQNRNIRKSEDLFDFNREEAMNILVENRKVLENYVYNMKNSLALCDYESVSRNAYEFAAKASWGVYHPDFYQSPEIENILLECANKLPTEDYVIKDLNSKKRKVLHVLSEGYSTGGHTRLAKNWIKSDTDSIHSLVTTWQIESTPQWLLDEIKKSGGWIFSLETVSNRHVERAGKLRKLAYEWADIVILHMHMMDPIPVMAFGIDGGPPVIYMNHGDHLFWLGASIADLVVDLRASGQKLTLTRRSCNKSCILPIPLQAKKAFNKNEVREKYKINENETVILTIATDYKFRSINNNNYINIIKDIVNKVDNCRAFIIGPRDTGKWHEINIETGGKVKALGVVTEIEELYQMADIYLDCFMMGSMTSLLDASKYGLSIIKFTNSFCPILTEFDEEFEVCSYNNLDDIIQEINEIKNGNTNTYEKHKSVNNIIVKNHILNTQEKIKKIYSDLDNHKVNRDLKISNRTEDCDLFWILLIRMGYVYEGMEKEKPNQLKQNLVKDVDKVIKKFNSQLDTKREMDMKSKNTPLLTAHLFVSRNNSFDGFEEMLKKLDESGITVKLYEADDALLDKNPKNPRVYVSLGDSEEQFTTLYAMPYHERKRWLHYTTVEEVEPANLFYCWLNRTDPIPKNKIIPNTQFSSDTPLVSVFTAAYKSKEKIQRPFRSLLNQTYSNWEWVIVDDSGDDDATYNQDLLPLDDPRVRRYRQDFRSGYIGAIKRYAAGLCTGEILVEVDHDDELTSDCLEKIVNAFKQHPECGFAYGDCTEPYVGSNDSNWYGWDCGFGYDIYYRVWVHEMNRWQNVLRNTVINGTTIRHLVGLPNHPRAWTKDCYHLLGGHREELLVADDYDILVRSFLCTKYVCIPDLVYIQYRNENGDNSTFTRNKQIQILVSELYKYYSRRIHARVNELGVHEYVSYRRVWEREIDDTALKGANIINEDLSRISILFPIPYSCLPIKHDQLIDTLEKGIKNDFKDIEVVVAGRIPEEIEDFASKAPMGSIRWWPMEPKDSLETCTKYAKFCSSCKEKLVILPESLQE